MATRRLTALAEGNAAKLYCLQLIEERVREAGDELTIVDLGCGDGRNFAELLHRYPAVRYVGVDPSAEACELARRTLEGTNAEILHAPAYDVAVTPADVVASFSVLEHVYRRRDYLACAKVNLAPGGQVLLNYDSGHFRADAPAVERWKTRAGRVLARGGRERFFQAPVRRGELERLVADSGLRVVEEKAFNSDLKVVFRAVHMDERQEFMRRWLEVELYLNEIGLDGREELWRTRNLVLEHA